MFFECLRGAQQFRLYRHLAERKKLDSESQHNHAELGKWLELVPRALAES